MNIDWFKCRLQQVDIGESATWFLLFFVYAYGLTTDELGIEWPRAFPLTNLSQASLILCLWCLGVSIVVLVEPWLPSGLQRCTTKFRHSTVGLCLRRASVLLAFVFGVGQGLAYLDKEVPTFSWLKNLADWLAVVIFIVMVINTVLGLRQRAISQRPGNPFQDSSEMRLSNMRVIPKRESIVNIIKHWVSLLILLAIGVIGLIAAAFAAKRKLSNMVRQFVRTDRVSFWDIGRRRFRGIA